MNNISAQLYVFVILLKFIQVFLFIVTLFFIFFRSKEHGFNETTMKRMFEISNALIQMRPMNETDEIIEFRRALDVMNWTIEDVMRKVMQPCDRMLRKCVLRHHTQINHITKCLLF